MCERQQRCRFCQRSVFGRGLCNTHYMREVRAGTLKRFPVKSERPVAERFLEKIDKRADGCWHWTGATKHGKFKYGLVCVGRRKMVRAHRFSYEYYIGPVGNDEIVCHKCDNPICVNPDHLFKGTRQDNIDDCVAKMRHVFGARSGIAKLSKFEVAAIRKSERSNKALAELYDISPHYVYEIRTGRKRPHG